MILLDALLALSILTIATCWALDVPRR